MYTLTLKIGGYDRQMLEKHLPRYFKEQGLGQVSKIAFVSEDSGYSRFIVDVFCEDASHTINMLEMVCSASAPTPDDMYSIDFYSATYAITRFPSDMGLHDVMGMLNTIMVSNAINRIESHTLSSRIERIEQSLEKMPDNNSESVDSIASVVNKITNHVFGHDMLLTNNDQQIEAKSRWLH